MATTKDKWTMTRDTTTGNYTLECKDANFDEQEKKIQVNCGNRNMTGDLVVDVKARTASTTSSANTSTNNLSFAYKNQSYLTVRGYPSITVSTSGSSSYYPGWYTGGTYSPYNSSIGQLPTSKIYCNAHLYTDRIPSASSSRRQLVMYPNSIYVVLNDSTNFWRDSSSDTVIWDSTATLEGGAVIFYNRSTGEWNAIEYSGTGVTHTCSPDSGTAKTKTCYLSRGKYVREIFLNSGFYTDYGQDYESGNRTSISNQVKITLKTH